MFPDLENQMSREQAFNKTSLQVYHFDHSIDGNCKTVISPEPRRLPFSCTSEDFRRLEGEIPYWSDRAEHCLGNKYH